MGSHDRLREELASALQRSVAGVRLDPEQRSRLRHRLLGIPMEASGGGWRRLLRPHAWSPLLVAALLAAVVIPLGLAHTVGGKPTYKSSAPAPRAEGGIGAGPATVPAACAPGGATIEPTPGSATLEPGQRASFRVVVLDSSCPLQLQLEGPSAAEVTLKTISSSAAGSARTYQVTWTGHLAATAHHSNVKTRGGSGGEIAPGHYTISLRLRSSADLARIAITVGSRSP